VPILVAAAALAAERDAARALIGGAFYALYVPINLVAYFSYGRLAPIAHGPLTGEPTAATAAAFVEIGHPFGLLGNLPILGYGILGLAWCILPTALWHRGRLWRVAVVLLMVSGILSVLGAAGGFTDVDWLTHGCFLGGVVSFPALGVLCAAMWHDWRRG
jgi:hypothetical protein